MTEKNNVVEEKDVPQALSLVIDSCNEKLVNFQNSLLNEINDAAIEIMKIMDLDVDDGWALDLSAKKFIKIEKND